MSVVDGQRDAAHAPDRVGPGVVARLADLGPGARLGERPPPLQPVGLDRIAQGLLAGVRVDLDEPHHAGVVELDHVARDVVEPLVGDEQAVDRRRQLVGPGDVVREVGRRREIDAGEPQRRVDGVQPREQLAAAGAEVDHRVQPGLADQPSDRDSANTSDEVTEVRKWSVGREWRKKPVGPYSASFQASRHRVGMRFSVRRREM